MVWKTWIFTNTKECLQDFSADSIKNIKNKIKHVELFINVITLIVRPARIHFCGSSCYGPTRLAFTRRQRTTSRSVGVSEVSSCRIFSHCRPRRPTGRTVYKRHGRKLPTSVTATRTAREARGVVDQYSIRNIKHTRRTHTRAYRSRADRVYVFAERGDLKVVAVFFFSARGPKTSLFLTPRRAGRRDRVRERSLISIARCTAVENQTFSARVETNTCGLTATRKQY